MDLRAIDTEDFAWDGKLEDRGARLHRHRDPLAGLVFSHQNELVTDAKGDKTLSDR